MTVRILTGDCREILKTLPSDSVDCCVSSPPYWGLRDYGVDGQIGLERSPDAYVETMVGIFRDVRRILKPQGTVWLNIGDTYVSTGGASGAQAASGLGWPAKAHQKRAEQSNPAEHARWRRDYGSLKRKDLVGIPWMVAFALRADGWYLRADHVWGKPNGMPESTEDRTTRSHEYVFHLSRSETYFHDAKAVRTAPKAESITRLMRSVRAEGGEGHGVLAGGAYAPPGQPPNGKMRGRDTYGRHTLGDAVPLKERRSDKQRGHTRRHSGFNDRWDAMTPAEQMENGSNLRSIWWVPPAQFKGEHFAVMPDLVAEICILAGSPRGGVILDPFGGVGTTGLVAERLGRDAILVELNPKSADMAARRLRAKLPGRDRIQGVEVGAAGAGPLFGETVP